MEIVPVDEIGRTIEQRGAANASNARSDQLIPVIPLAPDAVIAKLYDIDIWWPGGNNGVASVFLPGDEIIAAGGETGKLAAMRIPAIDERGRSLVIDKAAGPAA